MEDIKNAYISQHGKKLFTASQISLWIDSVSIMSYPYEGQFAGPQGPEDGNTPGAAGGGPQPQMGQPIQSTGGQFPQGDMSVPNSAGGPQSVGGGDSKTTLW